jgi:hypothetical protein
MADDVRHLDDDVKYLDAAEFRKRGYLHEVNRLVLHPLGLALSVERVKDPGRIIRLKEADAKEAIAMLDEAIKLLSDGHGPESIPPPLEALTKLRNGIMKAQRVKEGDEWFGHIWDRQDDPEGLYYAGDLLSAEKAIAVCGELLTRRTTRIEALGYVIQPIPDQSVLTTNRTDPTAAP